MHEQASKQNNGKPDQRQCRKEMQVEPTAMQAKQQRGMGQRRERGYDQCESLGTSITAGLRQHDGRGGREIGEDREQGKLMGRHG